MLGADAESPVERRDSREGKRPLSFGVPFLCTNPAECIDTPEAAQPFCFKAPSRCTSSGLD
jgi:hypothetical protein